MNVEVVGMGQCNLRCPSCPVGNMPETRNPMGLMKPELLAAIVRKAVSETAIRGFGLFNWGEPTIHPKIAELVRAVEDNGGRCYLSSNLNFRADWDAIMTANPSEFRISLSGFSQAVYGRTHRGGNIETVKKHMRELAEARQRAGAKTRIHALYHRYRGNLDDERLMRAYCDELGFEFIPVWAMMMPLEKILAFAQDGPKAARLNDDDREIIDRLALPLDVSLAASQKYRDRPCSLLETQLTLDYKGDTVLCCAVYDVEEHIVASYLDTPVTEIQARKQNHPSCGPCMEKGIHVYLTYGAPETDLIGTEHLLVDYANQLSYAQKLGHRAPAMR